MRKIAILFVFLLALYLTGCTNKSQTTTTNNLLSNDLYQQAVTNLNQLKSYTVDETADIKFTTDKKYEYKLQSNEEINREDHYDKVIMKTGYVPALTTQIFYINQENNQLYMYQTNPFTHNYEKTPVTQKQIDDATDNTLLNFIMSQNTEDFTLTNTQGNIKSFTKTFKLSDLDSDSQTMFDVDLTAFFGQYNYYLTKDRDITEIMQIDTNQHLITDVMFELTTFSRYFEKGNLTIQECTHEVKFSSFNEVTEDSDVLTNALSDDYADSILSPILQSITNNQTLQGQINYDRDIDIIHFNVTAKRRYYFTTTSDIDLKVDVKDSEGKSYRIFNNALHDNNFVLELAPGDYYIYVSSTDNKTGNYSLNVKSVNEDDYTDALNDATDILESGIINGNCDYDGDYDVFKLFNLKVADITIDTGSNDTLAYILTVDSYGYQTLQTFKPTDGTINISIKEGTGTQYLIVVSTGYTGSYQIKTLYNLNYLTSTDPLTDLHIPSYDTDTPINITTDTYGIGIVKVHIDKDAVYEPVFTNSDSEIGVRICHGHTTLYNQGYYDLAPGDYYFIISVPDARTSQTITMELQSQSVNYPPTTVVDISTLPKTIEDETTPEQNSHVYILYLGNFVNLHIKTTGDIASVQIEGLYGDQYENANSNIDKDYEFSGEIYITIQGRDETTTPFTLTISPDNTNG